MSGSGLRRPLLDFVRELRRQGLNPRLYSSRARLDAALADPVRRASLHALVAAGGDGTVLDVINRHPDVPIGIFPLGTENLLARQFGIPCDGAAAAETIASGRPLPLDLGRIGDRRFAIMVSIGFDAAVIHAAHAARVGHIRRTHYLRPIGDVLQSYAHPELHVYVDQAREPICGRLAIIANLASYALGLPLVPSARGDDGLLDVRVFHGGSLFHLLRYLYMVTTWSLDHLPDVTSVRAKSVRIESRDPAPIQADGDPAGATPCVVTLEPSAIRLIVPDAH
jgi:diacylglycerol kinase (ATP)